MNIKYYHPLNDKRLTLQEQIKLLLINSLNNDGPNIEPCGKLFILLFPKEFFIQLLLVRLLESSPYNSNNRLLETLLSNRL